MSDVEAILTAPETQDEGVWKYEHLRQFSMELNGKKYNELNKQTCTKAVKKFSNSPNIAHYQIIISNIMQVLQSRYNRNVNRKHVPK